MAPPKRTVVAAAEAAMTPPDSLESNQSLARILKPEGNNLYTCELPNKKLVLLELAQRFRNTVWVKRRGYVLVEQYVGSSEENRAVGEIVKIVFVP